MRACKSQCGGHQSAKLLPVRQPTAGRLPCSEASTLRQPPVAAGGPHAAPGPAATVKLKCLTCLETQVGPGVLLLKQPPVGLVLLGFPNALAEPVLGGWGERTATSALLNGEGCSAASVAGAAGTRKCRRGRRSVHPMLASGCRGCQKA